MYPITHFFSGSIKANGLMCNSISKELYSSITFEIVTFKVKPYTKNNSNV